MKFVVFVLSLVAVASARPGGSGGYEYNSQPSGSYLPSDGGFNLQGVTSNIGGYNNHFAQDQKHVYFFASHDDEGPSRLRVYVAPSGQRNTKLIFVKAPSYGAVIPEVVAPPSLSEDKTLVYVLVKKPEHQGAITIPAGATVKQAKPEVYFIKYRSQHDAEQAVSQGLTGHAAGRSLESLGSAQSFISTLGNSHLGGGGGDLFGSSLLGATSGGISTGSLGGSFGISGSHGVNGGSGGVGRYADSSDGYRY